MYNNDGGIMMDIKLVKQLRDMTGAGMLECKKALEVTNDNIEEAVKYLEKNTAHESLNARVASKGLTRVHLNQDEAILFEVNAETDFAAKNPHFIELLDQLAHRWITQPVKNIKEALALNMEDKSVEEHINYIGGLMKEHIYLRRFHRIKKQSHQSFSSYMHAQGKLSVLVILDHPHEQLGKETAMIIAANQPTYISDDKIDSDTLNYEKFMYEKNNEGFDTFDDFINRKLLIKQSSIFNPTNTLEQLLDQASLKVVDFYRFELGQGIEDKLNCRLDIPCDGSKITVTPIY